VHPRYEGHGLADPGYRRAALSAAEILAQYPSLRAEELAAADEHAAAHPEEIETALRDNEAGGGEIGLCAPAAPVG
jgi:hypothetical protein